jgi:titin
VDWPVDDGGDKVTRFAVRSLPGGVVREFGAEQFGQAVAVDGLTNGTSYTFTATAWNGAGEGAPAEATTEPRVPATTPGPPAVQATGRGDGVVHLMVNAPGSDGGDAVNWFTVRCDPPPVVGVAAKEFQPDIFGLVVRFDGLANGTAYTFTATAWNKAGEGKESMPSERTVAACAPDAPSIPMLQRGDGYATMLVSKPAFDGGAPVATFTVRSQPGGLTKGFDADRFGSPLTFTGLKNGTAYTFAASCASECGEGEPSAATEPCTPCAKPKPPALVQVGECGDGVVAVTVQPPKSDGGSALTGFTLKCEPGGATKAFTADLVGKSVRFDGLANGTPYTFVATATNERGESGWSVPSAARTPARAPAPEVAVTCAWDGAVIKATLAGIATAGELRTSLSASTGKAVALLYCEAEERGLEDSQPLAECDFSAGLVAMLEVKEQEAKAQAFKVNSNAVAPAVAVTCAWDGAVIKATLAGIVTAGELRASLSASTGKAVALLYCEAEETDLKDSRLLAECDLTDGLVASVAGQELKAGADGGVVDDDDLEE